MANSRSLIALTALTSGYPGALWVYRQLSCMCPRREFQTRKVKRRTIANPKYCIDKTPQAQINLAEMEQGRIDQDS